MLDCRQLFILPWIIERYVDHSGISKVVFGLKILTLWNGVSSIFVMTESLAVIGLTLSCLFLRWDLTVHLHRCLSYGIVQHSLTVFSQTPFVAVIEGTWGKRPHLRWLNEMLKLFSSLVLLHETTNFSRNWVFDNSCIVKFLLHVETIAVGKTPMPFDFSLPELTTLDLVCVCLGSSLSQSFKFLSGFLLFF
jgi:hypothetical protein